MTRFLIDEPVVVVPGRLCAPLWELLAAALERSRRNGQTASPEIEQLARDLMAASLASGRARDAPRSSDCGSEVDADSSAPGESTSTVWITTTEAADLLGVSDRRVRQLLDSEKLAGRRAGATRLVDEASVNERLRRCSG